MDRRRTKSLEGKCGSCRFFTVEQGRECTGFCSGRMKQKGRLNRTYKCIGYDAAINGKRYPVSDFRFPTKPSNADRIRAMTDEELAAKIEELCQYAFMQISVYSKPFGKAEWLDWLKREAT